MGELCIGSMGGDGWFATLDFDMTEATILRRGKGGVRIGPIAVVPMGAYTEEDDDHNPALCPDDEQNVNLMSIIGVPKLLSALRFAEKILSTRENREPQNDKALGDWRRDMKILREVQDAIEWATVVPE